MEELWAVQDRIEQQVHAVQLTKYSLRDLQVDVTLAMLEKFVHAIQLTSG